MIVLVCHGVVSKIYCSRQWVLQPNQRSTLLFTGLGVFLTLAIETYRVNISKVYGVPVFAVPILDMSFLAVLQWMILPPLIVYFARRHLLGYQPRKN